MRRADKSSVAACQSSDRVRPKTAHRTGGPFIIDAFFVRTADNSVRHHGGPSSGRVDEGEHFLCYTGIIADIDPSENQRRRSVASASSAGTMPTVSLVALVSSG